MNDEGLLRILLADEGYDYDEDDDYDEALSLWAFDSAVPGICRDCQATTMSIEPDADSGWCHDCGGNNVVSGLILAGVM